MTRKAEPCPCGSQIAFDACCGPLIAGTKAAASAEQLMRSRYSAYVKGALDYIYDTTHPAHRHDYDHDGTRAWAEKSVWQGLEILAVRGGGPDENAGEVEFRASYESDGTPTVHHELGRFRKKEGRWYFTEGKMAGRMPIQSAKVGRNDPCPCGSGAKYKKCCGR